MIQLQQFELYGNKLSGPIPPSFMALPNWDDFKIGSTLPALKHEFPVIYVVLITIASIIFISIIILTFNWNKRKIQKKLKKKRHLIKNREEAILKMKL